MNEGPELTTLEKAVKQLRRRRRMISNELLKLSTNSKYEARAQRPVSGGIVCLTYEIQYGRNQKTTGILFHSWSVVSLAGDGHSLIICTDTQLATG